jgi:NAD(P)-dependent dehydrogenase (short-subunit alcohol dehydrogenase family)
VALERIRRDSPPIVPVVWKLDLADLDSVTAFAARVLDQFNDLNLLINNAGVMATPYGRTREGFELQFGVNHLAHFALTSLLWPLISPTAGARVVNVSSLAHLVGRIRFHDIHWEKGYRKWGAYGMSKLANLLFTRELASRIILSGSEVIATSAHPGYAATNLYANGAGTAAQKIRSAVFNLANRVVAQPAGMGALPILYAATAEDVEQGSYYGPSGLLKLKGWPEPQQPGSGVVNDKVARELWELSETLTGREFPVS